MSNSNRLRGRLPLFAILRGLETDRAVEVARTVIEAGFDMVEVTMNSPDPFRSIAAIVAALGDRAMVGAGTLISSDQIDRLARTGAELAISAHCDPALIAQAAGAGLTVIPGVFTVSEIHAALKAGAHGVKIFPAEIMPPSAVKAIRAVLPKELPIFVVGGIRADNMAAYLTAGATGFGIGSSLFQPGKPIDRIAEDAHAIISAFETARGNAG